MKIDPAKYKATVIVGENTAKYRIEADYIHVEKRSVGFEFQQLVTKFDNSNFSIPHDRQATFQEELRAQGKAYYLGEETGREQEEEIIIDKLKEAYGKDAKIEIEKSQTLDNP